MRQIDAEIPVEHYDETDSTSALARRKIDAGEIGAGPIMLVAKRQTGGVGRFGRAWASPAGGLWCTIVWPVQRDLARALDGLGLRLALACARSIEHELAAHGRSADVRIKWPNDVLIDGRKVLGVLAEVHRRDGKPYLLVGVGVNADFPASDLPAELINRATTLRDVLGRSPNVQRLIDDLRVRVREAVLADRLDTHTLAEVRERLFGVGSRAVVTLSPGETITGVLVGLDDKGAPILRTDAGERTAPPGAELAHTEV